MSNTNDKQELIDTIIRAIQDTKEKISKFLI